MPTLRIYFDVQFKKSLEEIEKKLKENDLSFAEFDNDDNIFRSGFFKSKKIFTKINKSNYFVANYILKQTNTLPSKNSELVYFGLITTGKGFDEKEYSYHVLIKIILSIKKRVMCLFSKKIVYNDTANDFITDLGKRYGFSFKYPLIDGHFVFEKNKLNDFLMALGQVSNFTSICVYDQDNKLIAENRETLSETKRVNEFLDEVSQGKWGHVQLIHPNLDIEIKLSNKRTQNYITFISNTYQGDEHLIEAVDYIIDKIRETTEFETQKQVGIDYFTNDFKE